MEIILSEKGKKQILLNGFFYRLDRILVNGKESWRCTDVKCKGRIHVYEDTWENKAEHSHVPHPAEGAKKAMQSKLRQKASSSNDAPRRLIQESRLNLADEATAILPKYSSLQRTVQRHRKQHENSIPAPSNVSEIKIPDWLAKTHTGEKFLMFDSGSEDPNRIFIFSTPKNIEHLVENKHWMADGTFKIAPQLFYQLHVIHIARNGNVFPNLT